MLIAGPQMYTHYLGDSKAEFFFSGDLGTVNENGSIVMLGRKKDMIIRKGYNLYPGIFESTISKIPGIQECAIVGQYDDATEDEKVILFIVKETNSTISQSDIETRLRNGQYSIDAQAFPDAIIFINELPRSGRSKKVSKAELRKNITTTV
jgi:acyl-coenzyme A synthetase/AMP-(fatty) acid ligase